MGGGKEGHNNGEHTMGGKRGVGWLRGGVSTAYISTRRRGVDVDQKHLFAQHACSVVSE